MPAPWSRSRSAHSSVSGWRPTSWASRSPPSGTEPPSCGSRVRGSASTSLDPAPAWSGAESRWSWRHCSGSRYSSSSWSVSGSSGRVGGLAAGRGGAGWSRFHRSFHRWARSRAGGVFAGRGGACFCGEGASPHANSSPGSHWRPRANSSMVRMSMCSSSQGRRSSFCAWPGASPVRATRPRTEGCPAVGPRRLTTRRSRHSSATRSRTPPERGQG